MSESNPLVSVIIPVFRVEKYLKKGVSSITDQTYRNLEIILVDDGSDDGCPAICDRLSREDDRITSLHKTNGGLSDARNYGLKFATGKYIYFFDSDDYLEKNALSKLVETAEKTSAGAVAFGYNKVDEGGKILEESHMQSGSYSFPSDSEKMNFITSVLCRYKVGWEAWNRLFRADIIKNNSIWFEPNKEIFAEDRCFNIYYTFCSDSLVFIENRFYNYLIRDDSIMGKNRELKIRENLKLMDYIKRFAGDKVSGIKGSSWKTLNLMLFRPLLANIPRSDYKKYLDIWECKDLNDRFGNRFERLYYIIKAMGLKAGLKYIKMFEDFISAR